METSQTYQPTAEELVYELVEEDRNNFDLSDFNFDFGLSLNHIDWSFSNL